MASKLIIVALLCCVLVAVVQSAPQNAEQVDGNSPEEEGQAGEDSNDDDYDAIIAGLSESFGTAADPGRRVGEGQTSDEPSSKQSQSDASASDE